MREANPPDCQLVRARFSDDPYGDCPVSGCNTSIDYRPPKPVDITVDPGQIICDAARAILRGEG